MSRAVMQQALEALEDDCLVRVSPNSWERKSDLAILALKQALAEPEQNPFGDDAERYARKLHEEREYYKALFTAPTPRKPLPLKEVERLIYEHTKINPNAADDRELLGYIVNAVRAIERKHGIGEQT